MQVIDCGGWRGTSVALLRKRFKHHIYTFEPNPRFKNKYNFENHTLIRKAVWIYDGEIDFYLNTIDGTGSSIIDKPNTTRKIKVPCIDFSKWVLELNDDIILKMDIEGAEYKVLSKMIDDGSINRVKELLVELHHDKYPNIATEEEIKKISKLKIQKWN